MVLMQKITGVTEVVYEINWIKCKLSVIFIRQCCHSNRSNTLFIDITWWSKSYKMHCFSFILFQNVRRQFLMLKFGFFHFKRNGTHDPMFRRSNLEFSSGVSIVIIRSKFLPSRIDELRNMLWNKLRRKLMKSEIWKELINKGL